MIWNGGTFSWNWKVPSLNCVCAPLWMKLTGKLPVMVIPAAPMLDHQHPWSKHTLRKLAFDCVCETGIRCNSSFKIQWFIHGLYLNLKLSHLLSIFGSIRPLSLLEWIVLNHNKGASHIMQFLSLIKQN